MAKPTTQAAAKPTGVSNNTAADKKFSLSTESKICLGLLLLLLFIISTIRSKFLLIPFERDEGIYSYIGTLLQEGKIPYKDFYEQKFPGLFYFYYVISSLFGSTVEGMHRGFMYVNLITIIFIYFASERLFSPIAGIISATTFAFVSLTPNLSGFTVQSEHGVAFFIGMGLLFYALYTKKNTWYYNFLMGIAFGFAFMTKTSGIFLVFWGGMVLVINYIFTKDRLFKTLLMNVLIYSAGVFLIVGFFFLLILIKGSFTEMIYWVYEMPKYYVGQVKLEDGIKYFGYTKDAIIQNHKFFWVHGMLAVLVCFLKPINFKMKFAALTLLGCSFLTIVPGFFFYGHYWIQTVPGLAFLSGLAYYGIVTFLKDNLNLKQPAIKWAYAAVFLILVVNHVSAQKSYYFHPNYERILRSVYGSNPFPESMEIANFINANSKPEDRIALIGSEPQIYFYTKKKSPSRHAYFAALVSNVPQHHGWQKEFVADVEKTNPRYVVFFNHSISLLIQPNTDKYVFDWANKYITEGYHIVGVADMVDGMQTNYVWKEALAGFQPKGQNIIYIYERNTPPATAPAKP